MTYLLKTDLRLFGGENAGDGGTIPAASGTTGETQSVPGNARRGDTGEAAGDGGTTPPSPAATPPLTQGRQRGSGEAASVPQDAAAQPVAASERGDGRAMPAATSFTQGSQSAGAQAPADALEEKRRAFRELVNGEYKDIYTEETQRIINRRFKETAALRARLEETKPLLGALAKKYGVPEGDLEKLASAVEKEEAAAAGETATAESEDLRERDFIRGQVGKWCREADEVKAVFPEFDLEREMRDPLFRSMLGAGVPVGHAFKALHFDEMIGNAVHAAAEDTKAAVVANVRARGVRPQENGVASRSAFTLRDDVSKLTRADRADIAARVARGEIVRF